MKTWVKYGLLNAMVGLAIGGYLFMIATGQGYHLFVFVAPAAAFLAAGLFWKLVVRNDEHPGAGRIVATGLLTGTVSHYLAFVLISIVMNVCYWTTGGCTDSLGEPPANILMMLAGAFGFSYFSLIIFGWITVPAAVIIGLTVRR